ncbi:MAG TPA: hypothetical protein VF810_04005 [Patescibacteria group bacterium]
MKTDAHKYIEKAVKQAHKDHSAYSYAELHTDKAPGYASEVPYPPVKGAHATKADDNAAAQGHA